MADKPDIIIIGAGVIGVSAAIALQSRGKKVLIVDRGGVAAGASAASAGAFAFSDIVPLATPGIMRKAPKWLLDPMGPLSIPPRYFPKIAPWLFRFWRASWPDRYAASMGAQAALMQVSQAALERQVKDTKAEHLLQREGQLQLYESAKERDRDHQQWAVRRKFGIAFDTLDSPAEIAARQPGLAPCFTHAVFTPDWINTVDPKTWCEYLAAEFVRRGGRIEQMEITRLRQETDQVVLHHADEKLQAPQILIAAGAWSHQLARQLGDRIPLETERGYNTTLPKGAFDLKTHVTFAGHGFVVTRINGGVRVGGAVELGGLNAAPNFKRAEILLDKAKTFLPGLNTSDGKQWMGFRPSIPDSLPVIDRAPGSDRVFYAFGHGHLGLTQSAGTAELIAALMMADKPAIDLARFSANRF